MFVLFYVISYNILLYYILFYFIVLYYFIIYYITLYYIILCHIILFSFILYYCIWVFLYNLICSDYICVYTYAAVRRTHTYVFRFLLWSISIQLSKAMGPRPWGHDTGVAVVIMVFKRCKKWGFPWFFKEMKFKSPWEAEARHTASASLLSLAALCDSLRHLVRL